ARYESGAGKGRRRMLSLTVMLRATNPSIADQASSLAERHDQCAGYRVDGPTGRIGTLDAVGFSAATGRPDCLQIRTGLFARRVVIVSIDEVTSVDPVRRRVNVTRDMAK